MGIRASRTYAIALGLSFALVAVGGVFAGIRTTFTPESGPASLLYAFEAVVIGGLGSLWGTFAGAVILAIAQGVGADIGPASASSPATSCSSPCCSSSRPACLRGR